MKITPYVSILHSLIEKSCEAGYIIPGKGLLCSYDRIRKVLRYIAFLRHETFYYERSEDFDYDLVAYDVWDCHRLPDTEGFVLSFAPGIEAKAMALDSELKASRNSTRQSDMIRYFQHPTSDHAWMFEEDIIYEQRNSVLPLKNMLDQRKCVSLVTAPGLGKTKAIVKYIQSLPQEVPVVVVSFRIALSEKQAEDFKGMGFTHYSRAAQQAMLRLHELGRIIIQIDSLLRLTTKVDNFILVLDEWESLNEHLCLSPFITNQREIVNLLVNLIKQSKSVIIADANYSFGSHDFFRRICQLNPVIYYNDYIRNPRQASFFAGKGQLVAHIIVLLRKGKKIYVPTNSKRFAKYLLIRILDDPVLRQQKNPQLVKLYCNETKISPNVDPIHDMINYNCCIVTPKFQAGNSFTADHFDEVCGYFSAASCSPEAATQLIMRVRSVKSKLSYFCVDNRLGARKRVIPSVHNLYDMVKYVVEKDVLFSANHQFISSRKALAHVRLNHQTEVFPWDDPANFLAMVCAANLNEGHKNYAQRFINLLHRMGYSFLMFHDEVSKADKLNNAKVQEEMKIMQAAEQEHYLNELAQAPVLNDQQINELLTKESEEKISRKEKFQLTKFRLLESFDLVKPYDPLVIKEALTLRRHKELVIQTLPLIVVQDPISEQIELQSNINELSGYREESTPIMRSFYELEYTNRGLMIGYLLSFVRALGFRDFFDPNTANVSREDLIKYIKTNKENIEGVFDCTFTDKQLSTNGIIKWLNHKLGVLKISIKFKNHMKGRERGGYIDSPWRLTIIKGRVSIRHIKLEPHIEEAVYLNNFPSLLDYLTTQITQDKLEMKASLMDTLTGN